MKLFGTVLFFSLAVFSSWSAAEDVQKSDINTTTSSTMQTPSASTRTTGSTTRVPAATESKSTAPTERNTTSPTMTTSALESLVKSDSNSTTGRNDSLPPSSATPASKLTSATTDPTTNTTDDVRGNNTYPEDTPQNTTKTEHESTRSKSGNTDQVLDAPSYSSILLPVIIALIVITFSVCVLVALYRICWKTTPERQENEPEHTSLDKENVKLISVKTTSPESGEHSSLGKNKTRHHDDSSSHLGNKCV